MSRLEVLIQTLCPDGVEYKKLGDVSSIVRGVTYSKNMEVNSTTGYKILRANNITLSSNSVNFADVRIISDSVKVNPNQKLKEKDIFICTASGSKDHIGKVAYIEHDLDYYFGGFMAVIRTKPTLISRFLFHILTGPSFSTYLENTLNSSTINNLNSTILSGFLVPVPPLPVQEEIVRILDTFSGVVTELEQKLEAEQAARTQQYEHYRNELLAFEKPVTQSLTERRVRWVTLGEIATVLRGTRLTKSQLSPDAIYPVFHGGLEPLGYYGESNRPAETVMVINVGASVGTVGYSKVDFWSSDGCFCVKCSDEVIGRYMYYALVCQQNYLRSRARFAGIPTLDNVVVEKIEIPLPSLEEQVRIIKTLDLFDTLVNDLKSGLPAEIALRRKQYEYYRDKLLNFKPKQPPL